MTFYPLTEIILYIALFFAPPDTTHVTVAGPDFSIELTRGETVWTAGAVKLSAANGLLTREENSKQQSQAVDDYVKPALNHDWTITPKVTLHALTTLEKTTSGFVVRVNDGDAAVRTYTITYRRPPAPIPAATASGGLTINVLGAVNKPGAYPLPGGATLLDALAAAGGLTPAANARKASLLRGPAGEKPAIQSHDTDAILRGEATNPPLLDRDTLFVPERFL